MSNNISNAPTTTAGIVARVIGIKFNLILLNSR
jgi:hypothetical protein